MRILLGLVLALSVSLACDQPHEEVGGYKIGCPFEDKTGFSSQPIGSGKGVSAYSLNLKDSFFDTVDVRELNGNIEELTFRAAYPNLSGMYEDKESLLELVGKKWGKYEEIEISDDLRMYSVREPNSDHLDSVIVIESISGSLGVLSISYPSKVIVDHLESASLKEKKSRADNLKGF